MEPRPTEKPFDVIVVGAGASGSALFYTLSKYAAIPRLALIEKYARPGMVNSDAHNNSQTLHVGDIETNYSIEKVREVYPAAMMVRRFTDSLPEHIRTTIIQRVQKIVLAVGAGEVAALKKRAEDLSPVFPTLQPLAGKEIAAYEPELMRGRKDEPVFALMNPEGYAVNYGKLSGALIDAGKAERGSAQTFFDTNVERIERTGDVYMLHTSRGTFTARIVVFDTDAYSLGFAKSLGYGTEFSLIPIAGSFYFTEKRLRGKVYRVQDPRMPFAAVHGDPELTDPSLTRWGPTARFYPVLEARKISTLTGFFASAGFERLATWVSFASILLDPVRFWYLLRNLFYDLPVVGTLFLLPQLRKIVPTLAWRDISRANGFGGMRLQRVDTRTRQLLLGEGKIVGENIIFNMSPSPGASVCLHNALRDAQQIAAFAPEFVFDKERMLKDLCITSTRPSGSDVSLAESYAS